MPESLEDRIAPAAMMDALTPAAAESGTGNGAALPAEAPFFGPLGADAVETGSTAGAIGSGSIGEGRVITEVPASGISPAFAGAVTAAPLAGLDATLAFRGLIEGEALNATGIRDILGDGVAPAPDSPGLAQSAALSALTTVAGLTSPVLLVDAPKISRPL